MGDLIPPFDCQQAITGLLASKKMNQTEVGEAIGITQGRVSQIKNGLDSESVKYETRYKLYELCLKHGVEVKIEAA